MQQSGLHDRMTAACWTGIAQSGCAIDSRELARVGIEHLHRFVDAGDLPRVTTAVQRAIQKIHHAILSRLLREGLGFDPAATSHHRPAEQQRGDRRR
jgi:hypothetical protein